LQWKDGGAEHGAINHQGTMGLKISTGGDRVQLEKLWWWVRVSGYFDGFTMMGISSE